MAITLAQAKVGMADKVDIAVVDEFRRSSFLLDNLVFDNAVSPGTGGSTLTYGYLQLKTPSSATKRSVNNEYTANEAIKEKKTADLQIMGGKYQIDRVLIGTSGALDELAFQMKEKVKATANYFHNQAINGSKDAGDAFDGLKELLKDTDNEHSTSVDISTSANMTTNAQALLDEVDALIGSLDDKASALMMNNDMLIKFRGIARRAGCYERSTDAFGKQVDTYNGIPFVDAGKYFNGTNVVDVIPSRTAGEYVVDHDVTSSNFATKKANLYTKSGDTYTSAASGSFSSSETYYRVWGANKTTDIYAVRIGVDGFLGVSVTGNGIIKQYTPDLNNPGAVKEGEVELVAAVALKSTKAAAVLHGIVIKA